MLEHTAVPHAANHQHMTVTLAMCRSHYTSDGLFLKDNAKPMLIILITLCPIHLVFTRFLMAGIQAAGITTLTTDSIPSTWSFTPLTTVFQYPSTCVDQWVQVDTDIVVSLRDTPSSYIPCQPGAADLVYWPGRCPENMFVASMIELVLTAAPDPVETAWLGYCCRRYNACETQNAWHV